MSGKLRVIVSFFAHNPLAENTKICLLDHLARPAQIYENLHNFLNIFLQASPRIFSPCLQIWCQITQNSLIFINDQKHGEIFKQHGPHMPINTSWAELDLLKEL